MGRRPETESGLSSVSLLDPRLPGAPPGIGLGLKKRRNGRGRQQRPSRVNTAPGRSRGGPNPIRIIKQYGRDPLRKQGWSPCGNCSSGRWWPCTGSARPEPKVWGVTPTWGGGEGAGGGSRLASRRPPGFRSCPGQSPLPGVSGSVPRVWELFFGAWGGLVETCGFRMREDGGPCKEASPVETEKSLRGVGGGRYPPPPAASALGLAWEGRPFLGGLSARRHPAAEAAPGPRLGVRGDRQGPAGHALATPGQEREAAGRLKRARAECGVPAWAPREGSCGACTSRSRRPAAWPAAGARGASGCAPEPRSRAQPGTHRGAVPWAV